MKFKLKTTLSSLILGIISQNLYAAQPVGQIDFVAGNVGIYGSNKADGGLPVALYPVLEGDTIVTGDNSEAHVVMSDSTILAVRPNSIVKITKFSSNQDQNTDQSIISVIKGALRTITGFVGKLNPNNVTYLTPTATIGVRGTDHEIVINSDSSQGIAQGTFDYVYEGTTYIKSASGVTVDVPKDSIGFVPAYAPGTSAVDPSSSKLNGTPGFLSNRNLQGELRLGVLKDNAKAHLQQVTSSWCISHPDKCYQEVEHDTEVMWKVKPINPNSTSPTLPK